ncbi:MAG: hypothetical protein HY298_07630 [Verrucomicrobia bacterium]|nr:hypothetical protein [Verrucomicrobiota bacterium]
MPSPPTVFFSQPLDGGRGCAANLFKFGFGNFVFARLFKFFVQFLELILKFSDTFIVRLLQIRDRRWELQLFPELQHQFIEARDGDESAMVALNDFMNLGVGFILRSVTPEDPAFDRSNLFEESHKTAIIAAIADDNRCVVVKYHLQCRFPFGREFFNFFRLALGFEQKIAMNLGDDGTFQVGPDEAGERFMATHKRVVVRVSGNGVGDEVVEISGDGDLVLRVGHNLRQHGIAVTWVSLLHRVLKKGVALFPEITKPALIDERIKIGSLFEIETLDT